MALTRKTPMSRGTSQLKRTAFPRKSSPSLTRSPLKKKARKPREWHDKQMRDACRGEPCYLRVPGICCGRWETVVPCHSNSSEHGKAGARKADDKYTVPGCMTCHWWLDQSGAARETKFIAFRLAYAEWEPVRARKMGLDQPNLEEA